MPSASIPHVESGLGSVGFGAGLGVLLLPSPATFRLQAALVALVGSFMALRSLFLLIFLPGDMSTYHQTAADTVI